MIMRYSGTLIAFLVLTAPAVAQDMPLSQILIDGEPWKLVTKDYKLIAALAADKDGIVYLADPDTGVIARLDKEGKPAVFARLADVRGLAFDAKGQLYASQPTELSIRALDGSAKIVWQAKLPAAAWDLAVSRTGVVYASVPAEQAVYAIASDGKSRKVTDAIGRPSGIVFWPDQGTLVIGDGAGKHLFSFRVEKDGSLTCKDGHFAPRLSPGQKSSAAAGMTVDSAGRLYLASPEGVQVFDPSARLSGVLLRPADGPLTAVTFGGPTGDTLFLACSGQLYARKIKAKGVAFPSKAP